MKNENDFTTTPDLQTPENIKVSCKMALKIGVTARDLRREIKPLFMWMYDNGIDELTIRRRGKEAGITVKRKTS